MSLPDSIKLLTRDNTPLLHINNDFAVAEISLFGGHILSFKPKHDNRERLWLSEKAIFNAKTPIRGGIPVCWPWFGAHSSNPKLAAHGYVRAQMWEILSSEDTDSGTTITMKPHTSDGDGLPGNAQLTLVVNVGQKLTIQLHTTNTGDSVFTYTCALHSYFAISNIHQCELSGLSAKYSDKTREFQFFDTPTPYRFTEETDRVHLEKPKVLTILDDQMNTDILSSGHDSMVVWNPWQDKSITMSDMADDSYLTMLCVETAVTQGQEVKVGETHILEQIIV